MVPARGQALVEFALILPILLTLLLGGAVVGLSLVDDMRLTHAAIRGVDDGADVKARKRECPVALATAESVLGRSTTRASCRITGQLIELNLVDVLPYQVPFVPWTWTVSVVERANLR